jgi:hypothetical protein
MKVSSGSRSFIRTKVNGALDLGFSQEYMRLIRNFFKYFSAGRLILVVKGAMPAG